MAVGLKGADWVKTLLALSRRKDLGRLLAYPAEGGAIPHRQAGAEWARRAGLVTTAERVLVSSSPVPPTMAFGWRHMGAFPELQPDTAGNPHPMMEIIASLRGGGLILHGEEEFEYHRWPVVGDDLVGEGRIADVYEKESKGRTMTFIVTETVWKDAKTGDPVVTERFNLIHRS